MASEIRVNKINSRTGVGTITLSPTGVDFTGIATVATLKATTGIVTTFSATGNATIGGALSVTGNVDIADKIVHTGDTNTAIRFPAADTVTVETTGSERVRIDSSGDYLLLGGTLRIKNAANDAQRGAIYGDASSFHINAGVNNLIAYSAGSERLRIDSSGNVGINATSPGAKLDVQVSNNDSIPTNADMATAGVIRIQNTNNSAVFGGIGLQARSSSSAQWLIATQWKANNQGDLVLRTRNASTTSTEIGRFLNGGGLTFNGDTAAANALDDYEEGTFTATCSNSVTLHSDTNLIQYVKIGASVTVMGQIRVNDSNSGSSLTINNLPFTVFSSGEASAYAVGAVRLYSADMASDHKYVVAICDGGSTNLTFQGVRDNNTSQGLGASDNGYYMFSVTYRTST